MQTRISLRAKVKAPVKVEMTERTELSMEGRTMEEIIVFIATKSSEDPERTYYLSGDRHAVVSAPKVRA